MGDSKELTEEVTGKLLDWGADLVGFASIDRFSNAPKDTSPDYYMPDATGVIAIACHITDGICDTWGTYEEEGKSITPYLFYGYGLTNLELARLANRMAKLLERKGHKTLTFPPTWTISMYRHLEGMIANELMADFSHRHAAAAAGLGELGLNGLLLTPQFGARQRVVSIITNAPLEPTELYSGKPVCDPDKCGNKCIKICPTEAFSETERISCEIGTKTYEYAKVDKARCTYGIHGLVDGTGGRTKMKLKEGPASLLKYATDAAQKTNLFDKIMLDNCFGIICGDFCGKCLHQCPASGWVKQK